MNDELERRIRVAISERQDELVELLQALIGFDTATLPGWRSPPRYSRSWGAADRRLDLNSFTEDEPTGAGGAMSAPTAGRRGDRVEATRRLREHCALRTTTSGASIEALASGARGGQDPGSTSRLGGAIEDRDRVRALVQRDAMAVHLVDEPLAARLLADAGKIRLTDAERDAPYDDLERAREPGISLQRLDRGTPVTDRRSCDADGRPGSVANG